MRLDGAPGVARSILYSRFGSWFGLHDCSVDLLPSVWLRARLPCPVRQADARPWWWHKTTSFVTAGKPLRGGPIGAGLRARERQGFVTALRRARAPDARPSGARLNAERLPAA